MVLPHGFERSNPSSQEMRPLPFASHHSMMSERWRTDRAMRSIV